jgi:hypothetical protein
MKTPREILMAHHRAAEPKLDAIRRAVVAGELNSKATKEQSWAQSLVAWFLGGFNTLWRELILPSQRVWAGLAAVWVLIIAANVVQRDHSTAAFTTTSSAPAMMTFRDQQRLLNELLADRAVPLVAEKPKSFSPKPRTQIVETVAV